MTSWEIKTPTGFRILHAHSLHIRSGHLLAATYSGGLSFRDDHLGVENIAFAFAPGAWLSFEPLQPPLTGGKE